MLHSLLHSPHCFFTLLIFLFLCSSQFFSSLSIYLSIYPSFFILLFILFFLVIPFLFPVISFSFLFFYSLFVLFIFCLFYLFFLLFLSSTYSSFPSYPFCFSPFFLPLPLLPPSSSFSLVFIFPLIPLILPFSFSPSRIPLQRTLIKLYGYQPLAVSCSLTLSHPPHTATHTATHVDTHTV